MESKLVGVDLHNGGKLAAAVNKLVRRGNLKAYHVNYQQRNKCLIAKRKESLMRILSKPFLLKQ